MLCVRWKDPVQHTTQRSTHARPHTHTHTHTSKMEAVMDQVKCVTDGAEAQLKVRKRPLQSLLPGPCLLDEPSASGGLNVPLLPGAGSGPRRRVARALRRSLRPTIAGFDGHARFPGRHVTHQNIAVMVFHKVSSDAPTPPPVRMCRCGACRRPWKRKVVPWDRCVRRRQASE